MNKSIIKLGKHAFVTKLAGFEHSKYFQYNATHEVNEIPLIQGKNIRDGKVSDNFEWYISKNISDALPRSVLNKRCIVIPYVGSKLGELAIFEKQFVCHLASNVAKVELLGEMIDLDYLYYYLKSGYGQAQLFKDKQGSAQPNITMEAIRETTVVIFDKQTQQKIAAVLSSLDSKIELNNRINAELEQMAKTIYDYWFVQFDFPISAEYAVSVGQPELEGKPYKSSGGKMVWSDELKREVPEGWEPGTFNSYCPSTGGFAFKSEWWTDKGVAVAKIKDIQEDYRLETSDLARVDISDKNIDEKFKSKPGDILIAMTGATVGKYAIVPITDYPIYVNQRVGYFNLGNNPCKRLPFLINSMNQSYFRNAIFTLANGAAQPNISNDQINNIPLLIPKAELISEFNRMFESYYKKILINQSENQKLTELRDWLLPMLMNGQVKVGDNVEEEMMGMAAEPLGEYKVNKK